MQDPGERFERPKLCARGFVAERLRFPRFAAQSGEMLTFAHNPTGAHNQQQN
jgi:hypothetical protein